ncbi:MAG: RNA-binding protein [Lachnospiraceae bacterium]|nr:RNA-binding protein [Lachnospiraceae bacterium]
MADKDYLAGRVRELAQRTWQNDFLTHTAFLTLAEQARIRGIAGYGAAALPVTGDGQCLTGALAGVPFVLYGGFEEAERRVLCFLPSYLEAEDFAMSAGETVSCIEVRPLNVRFADKLTHRDFLGALMNLGLERDQIGDIVVRRGGEGEEQAKSGGTDCAYIFAISDAAEVICSELTRVKHTSVMGKVVPAGECVVRPAFEIREGSVASERLDAVLAFVFRLSRQAAQDKVAAEEVFVDGVTASSAGMSLKTGSRVSLRGCGKFVYEGELHETRKGRCFVRVKLFV